MVSAVGITLCKNILWSEREGVRRGRKNESAYDDIRHCNYSEWQEVKLEKDAGARPSKTSPECHAGELGFYPDGSAWPLETFKDDQI